jgi:lysophospholipase L1-like esterase
MSGQVQSRNWVAAWYAAPCRMFSASLSGRTLRQIVHLHAGGEEIRLRLSNRYGDEPVTLSSIAVEHVPGPADERAVTFEGQTMLQLDPGKEVISDSITLRVEGFSDLAISFFLSQGDSLTGHWMAQQTSYVSGLVSGNSPAQALFGYPLQTSSWWLISGVDVLPSSPIYSLVAFGSSTTDGAGSTIGANRRWPDYLARKLRDAGGTRFMSVINAGLSGNMLTGSPSLGQGVSPFIFGEAGQQRFAWDALQQPGATDLILHIGSNDLRFGVSGKMVIDGLQQLAKRARRTYRRIFGTTILPGGYSPEQAEQRRLVNEWILDQGRQCFDAVFDFASPLRSCNDEVRLNPAYDSGDGIHPNDEGYRLMAEAVDINQLTGLPGDK